MPKSPSRNSPTRFELFAVTAPGLETITAGELKTLGLRGSGKRDEGRGTREAGGVSFAGDLEAIYRANLWLRTASRVLLRLGRFHASTFYELERRAKKLDWAAFLPATGSVEVRVTCRKSRLYHSDAVAERILGAIARVAPSGLKITSAGNEDVESEDADAKQAGNAVRNGDATVSSQSFVVRIVDDQCEISADTSGELLHRRGYRLETGKAPLRETLAAAMVLASGWKNNQPLVDPMCGSGTIPIEASLIARRMAPGLNRRFQFMNWASFDRRLWNEILGKANDSIIAPALRIQGSDRDPGAIESAKRNAERAGVASDVQFSTESVSGAFAGLEDVADGEGWIITNPPYGVRVGEGADLRNLYATLGNSVKAKAGWRVGVLAAEDALAGQMRVPLRSRFESRNGGIPVRFLVNERIEYGIAPAVR
jgi:putative N6-adenine-specific DNA methylase